MMTLQEELFQVYAEDMTWPDDWNERSEEWKDAWATARRSAALVIVERNARINELERERDDARAGWVTENAIFSADLKAANERIAELERELASERFKHDLDHKLADKWRTEVDALRSETDGYRGFRARIRTAIGDYRPETWRWSDAELGFTIVEMRELIEELQATTEVLLGFTPTELEALVRNAPSHRDQAMTEPLVDGLTAQPNPERPENAVDGAVDRPRGAPEMGGDGPVVEPVGHQSEDLELTGC